MPLSKPQPLPTLVIFNYTLDESHPSLSHQVEVVKALSLQFSRIIVLTGYVNWTPPTNKIEVVCTNWIPGNHFRNTLRFYVGLFKVLTIERRFVVFSHMTLVQSFLSAIVLKMTRNPHFLWYAHKQNSFMLRFVSLISNGVITSTRGSCPIKNKKVHYIGQSIDEVNFSQHEQADSKLTKFIHIGRADPSKNLELIIESINNLRINNPDFELVLLGNPSNENYLNLYRKLQMKWKDAIDEGWLTFLDAAPRNLVPILLSQNHVFVHAYSGSLDKTLIEATMHGLPVATLNREYREEFGSWSSNSSDLCVEIRAILGLDSVSLGKEIQRRRQLAVENHSLNQWINSLTTILKPK